MSDTEKLAAAEYVVQKWYRLKRARANTERQHVTQSELDIAKLAAQCAETFFTCAVEDMADEFPEVTDDV